MFIVATNYSTISEWTWREILSIAFNWLLEIEWLESVLTDVRLEPRVPKHTTLVDSTLNITRYREGALVLKHNIQIQ